MREIRVGAFTSTCSGEQRSGDGDVTVTQGFSPVCITQFRQCTIYIDA